MLHKNKKLTKRLLELKSERHRLSLHDRIVKILLKKYNIPYSESELIDNILFKEGHLKYENYRKWTNEFSQDIQIHENPYITNQGLNALKNNYYYMSSIIAKKLKIPQLVINIILMISTTISILINIVSRHADDKLNDDVILFNLKLDSLKSEIISLKNKQIQVDEIIGNIKSPIIARDVLKSKTPNLIEFRTNEIDSTNMWKNESSRFKK